MKLTRRRQIVSARHRFATSQGGITEKESIVVTLEGKLPGTATSPMALRTDSTCGPGTVTTPAAPSDVQGPRMSGRPTPLAKTASPSPPTTAGSSLTSTSARI